MEAQASSWKPAIPRFFCSTEYPNHVRMRGATAFPFGARLAIAQDSGEQTLPVQPGCYGPSATLKNRLPGYVLKYTLGGTSKPSNMPQANQCRTAGLVLRTEVPPCGGNAAPGDPI